MRWVDANSLPLGAHRDPGCSRRDGFEPVESSETLQDSDLFMSIWNRKN